MRALIFAAAAAIGLIAVAAVQSPAPSKAAGSPEIDYAGFERLTGEVEIYRSERLVSLDEFKSMAGDADTMILDSRSADAFRRGHVKGAVNLPFSDFTAEKLEYVIGDPNRRILIYCNNNFTDNAEPIVLKAAPLALNIPTFINLYGYGYENLYELGDQIDTSDPRLEWVTSDDL